MASLDVSNIEIEAFESRPCYESLQRNCRSPKDADRLGFGNSSGWRKSLARAFRRARSNPPSFASLEESAISISSSNTSSSDLSDTSDFSDSSSSDSSSSHHCSQCQYCPSSRRKSNRASSTRNWLPSTSSSSAHSYDSECSLAVHIPPSIITAAQQSSHDKAAHSKTTHDQSFPLDFESQEDLDTKESSGNTPPVQFILFGIVHFMKGFVKRGHKPQNHFDDDVSDLSKSNTNIDSEKARKINLSSESTDNCNDSDSELRVELEPATDSNTGTTYRSELESAGRKRTAAGRYMAGLTCSLCW
ncbi:hypothetical protein CVT24_003113 [Panaeolus cyanescens]|uniref:Uncharacterized protein n=1 Tax=Panaeolus cyanescens TaxID=181874 RepID=A0A409YXS3_9AGAR|nr:hypothetical protein CVT24_003113 [Panaeolus cyanescens]